MDLGHAKNKKKKRKNFFLVLLVVLAILEVYFGHFEVFRDFTGMLVSLKVAIFAKKTSLIVFWPNMPLWMLI